MSKETTPIVTSAAIDVLDIERARMLNKLTREFYDKAALSFSHTRSHAWQGWQEVFSHIEGALVPGACVLDVACGNLRFERFLAEKLCERDAVVDVGEEQSTSAALSVDAIDGSKSLVASGESPFQTQLFQVDISDALLSEDATKRIVGANAGLYDLVVCFGFMHHLPLALQRERLLDAMLGAVKPGGFIAISFWQFEHDDALRAKAKAATARAADIYDLQGLQGGDYLLGWQEREDLFRFCHSFSEEEIDELLRTCGTHIKEIARFSEDGKSGDLNRYMVLQAI